MAITTGQEYGLFADRERRALRALRDGLDGRPAFGGYKQSGFGRELS